MDDFNFWWYIIAAVLYFLSRSRKKKNAKEDTTRPTPRQPSKSFEDLLKEITEGRLEAEDSKPSEQEPIEIGQKKEERSEWSPVTEEEKEKKPQQKRVFADNESKKIYEDSIKMAEGANLAFERNDHFKTSSVLSENTNDSSKSYAEELMDGFGADEAKKAVIYSEIFNRKY